VKGTSMHATVRSPIDPRDGSPITRGCPRRASEQRDGHGLGWRPSVGVIAGAVQRP
jgi:hypothetical protein